MGRAVNAVRARITSSVDSPQLVHKWLRRLSIVALSLSSLVQPAMAQQQQADAAPGRVQYSLLTPALAGKYVVLTVDDLMGHIALGGHTNSIRAVSLREFVEKHGYDASSTLALALKEELDAAGYWTEVENVPRARPGQPQRLTRADLPASPRGEFLLDVVIESIGLANESNGGRWEPMFKLTWRLMRPSGEIVVPSHVFLHGPFPVDQDGHPRSRTHCGLPTFNKTIDRSQDLLDCFDRGLREASRALVPLIREKHDVALHGRSSSVAGAGNAASEAATERNQACAKTRRPRDVLAGTCDAK